MGSKNNEPSIRFLGFNDNWEQRKLSEAAEIVGGGTPSTSNEEYWDGDIDWYTPAEINDQIFADWSVRKITELGLQKSSAKILPVDKTILFTSRAGIGKMAILTRPGATNQGFQSLVLNDETNPYFVFTMGSMIKERAEKVASGSTFAEISGKVLGNLEFMFPNQDEQVKIGSYFQKLDNLITLHQRKLDNLEILKKTFLDKLFPKNNETKPLYRFNGFLDDWEQRKLGEMTDYKNGKGHEDSQSDSGKYELVNLNSISIDGGLKHSGKFVDVISDTLLENDLVMVLSDIGHGDLLGRVALIPENDRFVLNQRVALLRPNETVDPQFMFSYINAHQQYFKSQGAGMSQLNISKGSVESFTSYVPHKEEQTKIGALFAILDNLITLHRSKCDHLKNMKKYFLNNMFI